MFKKFLLYIILSSAFFCASGQTLSKDAQFSLLTADPGYELYSVFGHSAIRIKDTINKMDVVYNYGTFDFSTPNFYMKFARGKLNYMLSIGSFKQFMPVYLWENRTVYEQVLNLTQKQKVDIQRFLQENYLPKNRYYKYDFFYDNCATRIRDVLDSTINDLNFETALKDHNLSYRDMIDPYLVNMKWSKLGIDIALGLPTDKKATPYNYMFLPDWMMKGFGNATINNKPLVKETNIIFKAAEMEDTTAYITPTLVFWLLLVIGIIGYKWPVFTIVYDRIIFIIAGLTGLLEVLLWFATDHTATHGNMNLIWAWPLHLFIAFYLKENLFTKIYFRISGFMCIMLLLTWAWLPQDLNEALIPLVLMIATKSLSRSGLLNINSLLRQTKKER